MLLAVDDCEETLLLLVNMLHALGVPICVAQNGRDALEMFKTHAVTCVITDTNMPNGNGVELVKEIRKIDKDIPILISFSGLDGFPDIHAEHLLQFGASAVIAKPYKLKVIRNFLVKKGIKPRS